MASLPKSDQELPPNTKTLCPGLRAAGRLPKLQCLASAQECLTPQNQRTERTREWNYPKNCDSMMIKMNCDEVVGSTLLELSQPHMLASTYIHLQDIDSEKCCQAMILPEKVGDESQPPNNCSVAKSTRRHTFVCFLYTRGPLHVSPAEPDLLSDHLARSRIEYPCQNCTAMGCIWARVGQLNRLPRGT